jgi:hypothetical protein
MRVPIARWNCSTATGRNLAKRTCSMLPPWTGELNRLPCRQRVVDVPV